MQVVGCIQTQFLQRMFCCEQSFTQPGVFDSITTAFYLGRGAEVLVGHPNVGRSVPDSRPIVSKPIFATKWVSQLERLTLQHVLELQD